MYYSDGKTNYDLYSVRHGHFHAEEEAAPDAVVTQDMRALEDQRVDFEVKYTPKEVPASQVDIAIAAGHQPATMATADTASPAVAPVSPAYALILNISKIVPL